MSEFAEGSIKLVDGLLAHMLKTIQSEHKMAPMIYEMTMTLREALSCWDEGKINAVAHESLSNRLRKTMFYSQYFFKDLNPVLEGKLMKNSAALTKSWQNRYFTVKGFALRFHKEQGVQEHKIINLREKDFNTEEVHNATGDPEFKITSDDQNKTHHFKCTADRERMKWMNVFEHYKRRRQINAHLDSLPVAQRIDIQLNRVFALSGVPRHKQFIGATLPAGRDYDPTGVMDPGSRFDVSIPQTFGKPKPRIFEFDLKTQPVRLKIYKTGESTPYIILERDDLVDFKFDVQKSNVTLFISRDKGKNGKVFTFSRALDLDRFKDVLNNGFRHENFGFQFVHHALIKTFDNLTATDIALIQRKTRSRTILDNAPAPSMSNGETMEPIQETSPVEEKKEEDPYKSVDMFPTAKTDPNAPSLAFKPLDSAPPPAAKAPPSGMSGSVRFQKQQDFTESSYAPPPPAMAPPPAVSQPPPPGPPSSMPPPPSNMPPPPSMSSAAMPPPPMSAPKPSMPPPPSNMPPPPMSAPKPAMPPPPMSAPKPAMPPPPMSAPKPAMPPPPPSNMPPPPSMPGPPKVGLPPPPGPPSMGKPPGPPGPPSFGPPPPVGGGPPRGPSKPSGGGGGRGNLLAAIQKGKGLKKVQTNDRSGLNSGGSSAPKRELSLQEQMQQQMAKRR